MAFGTLADYVVQFSSRGAEVLKKTIGEIHGEMEKMQAGAEAMGRKAGLAFATLTGTVGAFVARGFAGSQQMNAMAFQMERLSRGIAGMFVPEMNKVIDLVGQAADFFRSLTGAQQDNIKRWIEAAAVGLGLAMVLPKVFAGLSLVAAGFKAVAVGIAAGFSATGIGAQLPLVGAVVTGILALGAATTVGRQGFGKLFEMFKPVMEVLGKIASTFMTALTPLFNLAETYFKAVAANLTKMMPTIQHVVDIVGKAFGKLASGLEPLIPILGKVADEMMDAIEPMIGPVVELAMSFVDILVPGIQIAVLAFRDLMKIVAPVIKGISEFVGLVSKGLAGVTSFVGGIFGEGAKGLAEVSGESLKPLSYKVTAQTRGNEPGTLPTPAVSGTESLTATLGRLQQAALKQDYGRQVASNTRDTNTILGRIEHKIGNL